MITTVTDKQGNKYHLHIERVHHGVMFRLEDEGGRIGYANITLEGRAWWKLEDIQLSDDVPILQHPLIQRIRTWLHREPKTQSYRGRRLGTILLQSVIDEARKHHIRQIHGSTTADDRQKTPHLMAWYAKNGFREIRSKPGASSDSRVEVQIDLERPQLRCRW